MAIKKKNDFLNSVRPVKRVTWDAAGHYNFVSPIDRFCDDKRSGFRWYKVQSDIDISDCTSIVPGLSKLNRGVTRYHFRGNARDKAPMHSQIFEFTCHDSLGYNTRKFENKSVPSEISIIESRPVVCFFFNSHKIIILNIYSCIFFLHYRQPINSILFLPQLY